VVRRRRVRNPCVWLDSPGGGSLSPKRTHYCRQPDRLDGRMLSHEGRVVYCSGKEEVFPSAILLCMSYSTGRLNISVGSRPRKMLQGSSAAVQSYGRSVDKTMHIGALRHLKLALPMCVVRQRFSLASSFFFFFLRTVPGIF
jgi:hypothetical protein